MSVGAALLASEAYQRAVKDGDFARGRLPDDMLSVPLLDEAELRSALRLRTYSDLSGFDIAGSPVVANLPTTAVLPSLAETIPTTKLQVLLAAEGSEQAYAGSANDGQPLPEANLNYGAGATLTKLPRFGSATPVTLGVLDEPGMVASLLQSRFELGYLLGLENEMLNDSAAGFWTGILNLATNATGDATHAIAYARSGQYRLEAIVSAAALVQANGWYTRPLQVLSHPSTKAAAKTERATTSGDPVSLPSMIADGDIDIDHWLVTKFMAPGLVVVGDFFGALAIIQRGGLSMELAPNHRDFLARGMVDMKLETRLLVWPREPSALCIATGF